MRIPVRRALAWFLLALSPLAPPAASREARAQDAPPDPPQQNCSLSGTVRNAVTGAPLSRALVELFGASQRSALTDSEGQFHFEQLPAAEVTVSARKPGFFSEEEVAQHGQSGYTPAQVRPAPDNVATEIKLIPESIIFGRIRSAGEPVEQVPVKLFSPRIREGRKVWEQSGYATSDEEGSFRIPGLLAGTYYVAAGPSSNRLLTGDEGSEGYSEVFYPGVSDIASASPFDVASGQQLEADFSLRREPVFQVSGTIRTASGVRGVNLQFANSSGDPGSFPYRFDPVSGSFVSSVTAGAYTLRAQAFDKGQVSLAELPITVSSNLSGVVLMLAPAVSIPVRVSQDFVAAPGRARDSTPSLNMRFIPSDFQLTSAGYWATARGQGREQTLAFENVQPGRYATEFEPSGPFYVLSARCGETDLLREDLTVPPDSRLPPIDVVLRDDGATLRISMADPQAKATVLLVPDRAMRQVKQAVYSGQLQFAGLAPGEYSVLAFDNAEGLEYENPDVLSRYLASAVHVTVGPGQNSSITVQPIHWGT